MGWLPHIRVIWEDIFPSTFLLGNASVRVRGTDRRQTALAAAMALIPSPPSATPDVPRCVAFLEREPTNAADPHAIKVHIVGQFIGYVPREVALIIAPDLDRLREATGLYSSCLARLYQPTFVGAAAGTPAPLFAELYGPWPLGLSRAEEMEEVYPEVAEAKYELALAAKRERRKRTAKK